jgi:hypothetical protein
MDHLVQRYAAGVDVRHFQKLKVYTRGKTTKFMMCRSERFLRVRVEDRSSHPIDCMVYQIEPDLYWTRSLYAEGVPQVFDSPEDAGMMLASYVHDWMTGHKSNRVHEGIIGIDDDEFYGSSPGDAILKDLDRASTEEPHI